MLRLYGIPVAEPDARRLVASLIAETDPEHRLHRVERTLCARVPEQRLTGFLTARKRR